MVIEYINLKSYNYNILINFVSEIKSRIKKTRETKPSSDSKVRLIYANKGSKNPNHPYFWDTLYNSYLNLVLLLHGVDELGEGEPRAAPHLPHIPNCCTEI